ncbi:ATP-binding protein [uncultured Nitrospira sp.]|uniref:hybrid sensor histidine kinase/response regulator n=1 Tax=uncultured Nitrospira sp. TaxID=157176 RepID=UPI0031408DCE
MLTLPESSHIGLSGTPSSSSPLHQIIELRRKQIHQLFSLVPMAILASIINGGLVAFILMSVIPSTVVSGWIIGIVGINILWSGLVLAYRRASKPLVHPSRWMTWFVAGNSASGLIWGMAGIALYPPSSPNHQMFLALVLGGMAAGSTAIHAAYFPAFLAYSLPTTLPLIYQFFAQGDPPHQAVGIMGFTFLAVITVTAYRNFCMIKNTLTLEKENFELINQLKQAHSQAETLNRSLSKEIKNRIEIEKELLHHKDHLESLVGIRTADLQKSEARYRMVVEKISDVIWVMDLEGSKFSYISPSLERLLGYSGHALDTLLPDTILMPASMVTLREAIKQERAHHQSHTHDPNQSFLVVLEHQHHNGSSVWAEVRGSLLLDKHNLPIGITGVTRDVTERKKNEEEKQRLEAQLLRSQKLESVGNLAGGIAHDFNNFLTTILGNITLTKQILPSSNQPQAYLERAERAALHAKHLTHQLLTFSKGGDPIKHTVALHELIKESSDLALSGSSLLCQTWADPNLWTIEADPGQINQVLQNLLMNAIHAMPHGGSITIRAENIQLSDPDIRSPLPLSTGPYVQVTITDEGIGIAEDHLPKIFEPYFTTKSAGQGLGLASTYAIMKKHAGHVAVESQVGGGTTFTLYFPASPMATPSPKPLILDIRQGQGKILVMDDEESIRMMAGEMLSHCGYEVRMAKDGEEALALYQEAMDSHTPFLLVILDLTVPGKLGGMGTLARLRQLDPQVKALVSSGYSNDPIMANYASHGFIGVISKPYSLIELSNMVHQRLWRQSPLTTGQTPSDPPGQMSSFSPSSH